MLHFKSRPPSDVCVSLRSSCDNRQSTTFSNLHRDANYEKVHVTLVGPQCPATWTDRSERFARSEIAEGGRFRTKHHFTWLNFQPSLKKPSLVRRCCLRKADEENRVARGRGGNKNLHIDSVGTCHKQRDRNLRAPVHDCPDGHGAGARFERSEGKHNRLFRDIGRVRRVDDVARGCSHNSGESLRRGMQKSKRGPYLQVTHEEVNLNPVSRLRLSPGRRHHHRTWNRGRLVCERGQRTSEDAARVETAGEPFSRNAPAHCAFFKPSGDRAAENQWKFQKRHPKAHEHSPQTRTPDARGNGTHQPRKLTAQKLAPFEARCEMPIFGCRVVRSCNAYSAM